MMNSRDSNKHTGNLNNAERKRSILFVTLFVALIIALALWGDVGRVISSGESKPSCASDSVMLWTSSDDGSVTFCWDSSGNGLVITSELEPLVTATAAELNIYMPETGSPSWEVIIDVYPGHEYDNAPINFMTGLEDPKQLGITIVEDIETGERTCLKGSGYGAVGDTMWVCN